MAKFQFRLEPVLRQREAREDAAEQALALTRKEYNRRLNLLQNTRLRLEKAFTPGEVKELDLVEAMHVSFYRASLKEKICSQERDVCEAEDLVEGSRKEAVQARQERQIIEKVKEKSLNNFRRSEDAREQKLADELSMYSYLRSVK